MKSFNFFVVSRHPRLNGCAHLAYARALLATGEHTGRSVAAVLGVDESKVTLDARFREDLEADSLDLVELIMAFEDKFGGEISDEDAQKISTVGDAVKYIDDRMIAE